MLSVITALEFFQHYFAKMGHRNTSCAPHLHQVIEQPILPTLREASAARAATSETPFCLGTRNLSRSRMVGKPEVIRFLPVSPSLERNPERRLIGCEQGVTSTCTRLHGQVASGSDRTAGLNFMDRRL